MRNYPPPPPISDEALAQWLYGFMEWAKRNRPLPVRNRRQKVAYTRNGHYATPIVEEPDATSSAPGMVFRGEWRADVGDYVAGNVVVIRGGISAGTYIALLDVPLGTAPVFPDIGFYWASTARNYAGQWA